MLKLIAVLFVNILLNIKLAINILIVYQSFNNSFLVQLLWQCSGVHPHSLNLNNRSILSLNVSSVSHVTAVH